MYVIHYTVIIITYGGLGNTQIFNTISADNILVIYCNNVIIFTDTIEYCNTIDYTA